MAQTSHDPEAAAFHARPAPCGVAVEVTDEVAPGVMIVFGADAVDIEARNVGLRGHRAAWAAAGSQPLRRSAAPAAGRVTAPAWPRAPSRPRRQASAAADPRFQRPKRNKKTAQPATAAQPFASSAQAGRPCANCAMARPNSRERAKIAATGAA